MPRNGTGTYTLPVTAFVTGTVIISGDMNNSLSDIGLALSQSLATTGVSTMTGPVRLANGSVTAPSLTFNGFNGTGFYRGGANIFGIAVSSVSVGVINASATAIWGYDHIFTSAVAVASVIGVSGGITTSVTITGGLVVTGGLIVGFDGAPSVDQIQIGGANFNLNFDTGTTPRLGFDTNDFLGYTRASNIFAHVIGGTTVEGLSDTRLYYNSKFQLPEITAPASAPTNQALIYVKDNSGTTRVCYKDDQGNEVFMGGPGYWEVISTFTVTTSVASIQFDLTKSYSRLMMVGTSVSPSLGIIANGFVIQTSSDLFVTQPDYDGLLTGRTDGADTTSQTLVGAVMNDNAWNAQDAISFTSEYMNTNSVGYKGNAGYGQNPQANNIMSLAGVNSSAGYAAVNSIRGIFIFGNIFSGRLVLYGLLAR